MLLLLRRLHEVLLVLHSVWESLCLTLADVVACVHLHLLVLAGRLSHLAVLRPLGEGGSLVAVVAYAKVLECDVRIVVIGSGQA